MAVNKIKAMKWVLTTQCHLTSLLIEETYNIPFTVNKIKEGLASLTRYQIY